MGSYLAAFRVLQEAAALRLDWFPSGSPPDSSGSHGGSLNTSPRKATNSNFGLLFMGPLAIPRRRQSVCWKTRYSPRSPTARFQQPSHILRSLYQAWYAQDAQKFLPFVRRQVKSAASFCRNSSRESGDQRTAFSCHRADDRPPIGIRATVIGKPALLEWHGVVWLVTAFRGSRYLGDISLRPPILPTYPKTSGGRRRNELRDGTNWASAERSQLASRPYFRMKNCDSCP